MPGAFTALALGAVFVAAGLADLAASASTCAAFEAAWETGTISPWPSLWLIVSLIGPAIIEADVLGP